MKKYLSPDQKKELRYTIITPREESDLLELKTERSRQSQTLREIISRRAYRYRILEKPENIQKCIKDVQKYVKEKLPLYVSRLR